MPANKPARPDESLELSPLRRSTSISSSSSSSSLSPDSPLGTATRLPQPKWLRPSSSKRSTTSSIISLLRRLATHLRPRLTWRYILASIVCLYVSWCFIRGTPLLASPLPAYRGEYDVGIVDIEVPLDDAPRHVSDAVFKTSGEPAFGVETVLFTLYYPVSRASSTSSSSASLLKSKSPSPPPHPWLPRPISLRAAGFAKFAHVDSFLIRPIFSFALWAIAGSITIPAQVDAPLASPHNLKAVDLPESAKFPVMIFSHGMASSRTDYTHYLGELASRGIVVAAVEHRDGSCPGTTIINRKNGTTPSRQLIHFREDDLLSDPPMDTPRLKRDQLAFRETEMLETVRVLQSLNDGKGDAVFASSSRDEGRSLHTWQRRLDFDRLVVGGHSYGATGVLQALNGWNQSSKYTADVVSIPNPVGGIALDPGKSSGPLNDDITAPVLVVHSDSWSRTHSIFFGRPHFDTVRALVQRALNRTGASWFLTSIGTTHPSVTDAPILEPLLLSWTTGASLDVREALRQYVGVSSNFVRFLGGSGEVRGVLNQSVTHSEYGKWNSDGRRKAFPTALSKLWQVHVSPVSEEDSHS